MEAVVSIWNNMGLINQILKHKLLFVETSDITETSMALSNYRLACDNGRGAVFLSVARGKCTDVSLFTWIRLTTSRESIGRYRFCESLRALCHSFRNPLCVYWIQGAERAACVLKWKIAHQRGRFSHFRCYENCSTVCRTSHPRYAQHLTWSWNLFQISVMTSLSRKDRLRCDDFCR